MPQSGFSWASPMPSNWRPIETAPKDGTRFLGRIAYVPGNGDWKMRYHTFVTWWGKTSHVPLYGWCHGRVENVDLWEPDRWQPLTQSEKPDA